MIFTWDTTDLCIIFKWWHIRTSLGLWISLAAIVGLGAIYEYLRAWGRKLDTIPASMTTGRLLPLRNVLTV